MPKNNLSIQISSIEKIKLITKKSNSDYVSEREFNKVK